MKYIISYLAILTVCILISYGCSDLQDNLTTPIAVSVHGTNSFNDESPDFHGRKLINTDFQFCQECHAADFSGGTAGVACNTSDCHPSINVHNDEILSPASANFHGNYIAATGWKLDECAQCHGEDYEGGIASPTCNSENCHPLPNGPESCNTCHGDFHNSSLIAPPRALDHSSATTSAGVGAHSNHLFDTAISKTIECSECHILPNNFFAEGHIDNTPKAEVIFNTLVFSPVSEPQYNSTNLTCTNTYCHGNFLISKSTSDYKWAYEEVNITGNNFAPIWNKVDGTQAVCGSCHGLPPTGHIDSDIDECRDCHVGIIDASGNIIDKSKHINGEANVFGN